ncbi:hypothetical protein AC579_5624 [Pseudocercospora musae]|uniref:Uncharacterized protein n=1 Tax=Pseudocercospora musae TaxID=113226 RepID=A0A139IEE0_9PEZI|nr:hypothetical protein AC579_5624 [Pseudocercospora musae]
MAESAYHRSRDDYFTGIPPCFLYRCWRTSTTRPSVPDPYSVIDLVWEGAALTKQTLVHNTSMRKVLAAKQEMALCLSLEHQWTAFVTSTLAPPAPQVERRRLIPDLRNFFARSNAELMDFKLGYILDVGRRSSGISIHIVNIAILMRHVAPPYTAMEGMHSGSRPVREQPPV